MIEPHMIEIIDTSIIALSSLAGVTILAFAGLAGWRSWIELKRLELGRRRMAPDAPDVMDEEQPAVLIEMASVKERLRRLEAIASGVEL